MYYRLTYTASSLKEKRGDYFLNGQKTLSIGQSASCDVRLPDSDRYEPQVIATIRPNDSGDEWLIIKRTDFCKITINGCELFAAQLLQKGDRISFENDTLLEEFRFETFDDGEYDEVKGVVYKKHKRQERYLIATTVLVALALVVFLCNIFLPQRKELRNYDLSPYTHSIYQVMVDSVYLLCDSTINGQQKWVVAEAIELKEVAIGTAFLTYDKSTDDILLVTARHCVEPWINDEQWDGENLNEKILPEVKLAIKAETQNRLADREKFMLKAHCVVSKGLERYDFYSTDFCMNKSRDLVMRLGSTDTPYYWRTIMPIAHRRDMELGDFAYLKAEDIRLDKQGYLIPMANQKEIAVLAQTGNRETAVLGYPLDDNESNQVNVVLGNYMSLETSSNLTLPNGCLKLSAALNRGNSGGPILAMIDQQIKIIGIVSKADAKADQGTFWFVPITEVIHLHQQGDTIETTETYRR